MRRELACTVPHACLREPHLTLVTRGSSAHTWQEWLRSEGFVSKQPPHNGCFLHTDALSEPMMRHLDGKTYLDAGQRAEAGLPPYPTDWTAALRQAQGDVDRRAAQIQVPVHASTEPTPHPHRACAAAS